jgi:hypothetical protein
MVGALGGLVGVSSATSIGGSLWSVMVSNSIDVDRDATKLTGLAPRRNHDSRGNCHTKPHITPILGPIFSSCSKVSISFAGRSVLDLAILAINLRSAERRRFGDSVRFYCHGPGLFGCIPTGSGHYFHIVVDLRNHSRIGSCTSTCRSQK